MMKVLFDHPSPFLLAHGGFQTQIEQTKAALEAVGVEVEFLRWWDDHQKGTIIHYFGRPVAGYIEFAHRKGMKVVLAELLTGTGSRGRLARWIQRSAMRLTRMLAPSSFYYRMGWECYRLADACVALTSWEKQLMVEMFDAVPENVHCIPNGVEPEFLEAPRVERGPSLICTATITERKRVLELAEAAVEAQTPIWIVGKPYSPDEPYARRFLELVQVHPKLIRYDGPIGDRKKLASAYRQARGFVLLSTMESLSLSALEAAACECPLLLSDLPWARSTFAEYATYCPAPASREQTARALRQFYDQGSGRPIPPRPLPWTGIAEQLVKVYKSLGG